jgi:hypothetical protein
VIHGFSDKRGLAGLVLDGGFVLFRDGDFDRVGVVVFAGNSDVAFGNVGGDDLGRIGNSSFGQEDANTIGLVDGNSRASFNNSDGDTRRVDEFQSGNDGFEVDTAVVAVIDGDGLDLLRDVNEGLLASRDEDVFFHLSIVDTDGIGVFVVFNKPSTLDFFETSRLLDFFLLGGGGGLGSSGSSGGRLLDGFQSRSSLHLLFHFLGDLVQLCRGERKEKKKRKKER